MEAMKISTFWLFAFAGVAFMTAQACLRVGDNNACASLPNGDYNACAPQCEHGTFITCSNGIPSNRTCADGWYKRAEDPAGRFTAPTVYDPDTGRCQYTSRTCPRPLDNSVENRK